MAPVYCAHSALEPPGPEPEAVDPALVPAPNDAGTSAPAERSAQESLGPCVAQQEAPGPRVVRQKAPGPRVAQQRSPEAVSVYQENMREKDRHTKVAEPPGQVKTWTPTRGQEKIYRR